jgi:pyruvate kinase
MAQRAECVMLNKGPHVVEAIRFLSDIIGKMSRHQSKKYPLLGALHSWPLDALAIEARSRAGATKRSASPATVAARLA